MTSRKISIALAAVTAICAIGVGGLAPQAATAAHPAPKPASSSKDPHQRVGKTAPPPIRLLPSGSRLELKWSPMDDLAPPKRTHHHTNVTITHASVPPPLLNLELPASTLDTADSSDGSAGFQKSTIRVDQPAIIDPLVLNLNPNVDDHDAEFAEDSHLFNQNNGLRGFMAHNWLNENVGLQGGLAIKEGRLREEDSNLRDNVAVGMGILLAF